jgi:prepilin-type N-terminal cleavage/methylation domain-containing protein
MMKKPHSIESDRTELLPTVPPVNSKKRAGMTLVETLVALSLLASFSTGACMILVSHRKVADMARGHYTAINIAKNRMELVRTFDYGQVNDFLEDKVIIDSSGVPDNEGNYRRSTEVSNVSSNLLELKITVDMRNRETLIFNPANEILTTYFADYLDSGGGTAPALPTP